jgi:hypothetical protein
MPADPAEFAKAVSGRCVEQLAALPLPLPLPLLLPLPLPLPLLPPLPLPLPPPLPPPPPLPFPKPFMLHHQLVLPPLAAVPAGFPHVTVLHEQGGEAEGGAVAASLTSSPGTNCCSFTGHGSASVAIRTASMLFFRGNYS